MIRATLNGGEIFTRSALHENLAAQLGFPVWYGHNLDALYDCLTDLGEDTLLELTGRAALLDHLGGYAQRLMLVLDRAQKENPHFRFSDPEAEADPTDELTADQEIPDAPPGAASEAPAVPEQND